MEARTIALHNMTTKQKIYSSIIPSKSQDKRQVAYSKQQAR